MKIVIIIKTLMAINVMVQELDPHPPIQYMNPISV